MPRLPMTLSYEQISVDVIGLLDTGAAVNVLPYSIGLSLGANWDDHTTRVSLVGSLGQFDARALVVKASNHQISGTTHVQMVFAWTRAENVPAIFGQMNFFLEFDVCFFRSQEVFDVTLRQEE